jgi:hypothetical protein
MAAKHRLEYPHVFPDGRVEGGLFPPEYYMYPTDLFSTTWTQGLKAIEEFEWWPGPLEELPDGHGEAALEGVAVAPETVALQEPLIGDPQGRVQNGISCVGNTARVQKPVLEGQHVYIVKTQPEGFNELNASDTATQVENAGQDRVSVLQKPALAYVPVNSTDAASSLPQSLGKHITPSWTPRAPNQPKENSSFRTNNFPIGEETHGLSKQTLRSNERSNGRADLPTMAMEVDREKVEATLTDEAKSIPAHRQKLLEQSTAFDSLQSARSAIPDTPRLLRNMPFGPRTSPCVTTEAFTCLTRQTYPAITGSMHEKSGVVCVRDAVGTQLPDSSQLMQSPLLDNYMRSSTEETNLTVGLDAVSSRFLAGFEEAAAAAAPSTNSGLTRPYTFATARPLETTSVEWTGAPLRQHLAKTPELPSSPNEAEVVTTGAPPFSAPEADHESLMEFVLPQRAEERSDMSDGMSRLSLQVPPAIPRDMVPILVENARITRYLLTEALKPAGTPKILETPSNVNVANPRKRSNHTTKKEKASTMDPAALLEHEVPSDWEDGRAKKKPKTTAARKGENGTTTERRRITTTLGKKVLSEASEDQAKKRGGTLEGKVRIFLLWKQHVVY